MAKKEFKDYKVISNLRYNGKLYKKGTTVKMDEEETKMLVGSVLVPLEDSNGKNETGEKK